MSRIQTRECQNVEFKSTWHDKYLEWICGCANAQGAAMYFGVNDEHEVIGLQNVDKLMEDIPNKIVTTMGIVVDVNLHELDGQEYIEVYIEPSNIPINYKGKYYYRSGSTMQELRGPALQQFILKKMGRSWDDVVNDYATIDDIDRTAIDYFLRNGYRNGRISKEETEVPTKTVLENLHMVNEAGKLKNAALLLFSKKPQLYFTCVQFKIGRFGRNEANLITQDIIEGNVIQMADRVIEVLKSKYLTMPISYEGMNRIERLEIPEDALREILYNAIAHKDYTGAPIQMRVWDDHVDIWNEGELPAGLTPDKLLEQHSSRPRNKNVANAFFKAGFIEAWGRGYKKIYDSFKNAGLPMPKTEITDGGVRVTFVRNNVNVIVETTEKKAFENTLKDTLKGTKKSIVKIMYETPTVTISQIAEQLKLHPRGIAKHIKDLQELGILRRAGSDKGGYWEILI